MKERVFLLSLKFLVALEKWGKVGKSEEGKGKSGKKK